MQKFGRGHTLVAVSASGRSDINQETNDDFDAFERDSYPIASFYIKLRNSSSITIAITTIRICIK